MGTAGRKKNQFMALVDDAELDKMDALRIVMRESRAEVNRQALKIALAELEREHTVRLTRLTAVAASIGMDARTFVYKLVSGRQKVPTLEELEHMSAAQVLEELRATR